MRVLGACSIGGLGHLNPLLDLLDTVRAQGADVILVLPSTLEQAAINRGYEVVAGDEPPAKSLESIRAVVSGDDRRRAALAANRDLFGRLASRALLPAVEATVAQFRPDLILRETCEYASASTALRSGLPVAQAAIGAATIEWTSIELASPALEELLPGLTAAVRRTPYLTPLPQSIDPSPSPKREGIPGVPLANRCHFLAGGAPTAGPSVT